MLYDDFPPQGLPMCPATDPKIVSESHGHLRLTDIGKKIFSDCITSGRLPAACNQICTTNQKNTCSPEFIQTKGGLVYIERASAD